MSRTCTICSHKNVDEIDRRVRIENNIEQIANDYSLSAQSLRRHVRKNHHIRDVTAIPTTAELATSGDILREIATHHREAVRLKGLAEKEGDLKTALLGIREALKCLDLVAKIQGQIQTQSTINVGVGVGVGVTMNPEWIELRTVIVNALEPYPMARSAVLDAIGEFATPSANKAQIGLVEVMETYYGEPKSGDDSG